MSTYDVLATFKPPFIGSALIPGIESESREHAVMRAQAEVARRRLPPSTYSARPVEQTPYYPPSEVSTDWAVLGEGPVRKAMEVEHV